jgi:ATP-dependent helicase/nuclease subunit A
VHKAKGLEFPVVILADMTAKLRPNEASRWIDTSRDLCAMRIGGWSPIDLHEHDAEESAREAAEAVRLAYVAATRARDLLVVPVVGDAAWAGGWYEPLNAAIYPPPETRRTATPAPGCPSFRSKDSVLERPDNDPAKPETICPGLHVFGVETPPVAPGFSRATPDPVAQSSSSADSYPVVWWDPTLLTLGADPPYGVRREDLIVKDVSPKIVESARARYHTWRRRLDEAIAVGAVPSVVVKTVTEPGSSPDPGDAEQGDLPEIEVIELARDPHRPSGRRFGTLVHALLATVPLDAAPARIREVADVEGRILGAPAEEVVSATRIAEAALVHPVLARARAAMAVGRCRREVPIAWRTPDGSLLEGVVDLAFQEGDGWTVVDFKTDREIAAAGRRYQQQLRHYAAAVGTLFGTPARPVLVRL